MSFEDVKGPRIERLIQPQKVWGWEIAVDLYLAGMGAGAFVVGLILNEYWNFSLPSRLFGLGTDPCAVVLLWGPLLVVISTLFLVLDLGVKRRFLYACLNPKTSWVARGFLILSSFIVLGLIVFFVSAFFPHHSLKGSFLWPYLKGVSLLTAFLTTLYTGILLKSVRYVPLWNTSSIPILFLVSALLSGTAGTILALVGAGLVLPSAQTFLFRASELLPMALGLMLLEGLILGIHLYRSSREEGEGRSSVRLLLVGRQKRLFWGGIVLAGFLMPMLLQVAYFAYPNSWSVLILLGLSLLTGRFFLRWVLIASAVKERHPLEKLLGAQAKVGFSEGRARATL